MEEDAMDDTEDDGGSANAEGQSEEGDKGEAAIFAEGAQCVSEVAAEIVEVGFPAGVADLFFVVGDVTIKTGETRFISASEGAVIDIGSLTIGGNEGRYYCLSTGTLDIEGGSGVVLNVHGRLSIGSCGQVYNTSNTAVINVPGRGPSVRIGGEAYVEVPILAPGRNAIVTGSNNDGEGATFVIPIWAKGARMTGLSLLDDGYFYSAGCPQ